MAHILLDVSEIFGLAVVGVGFVQVLGLSIMEGRLSDDLVLARMVRLGSVEDRTVDSFVVNLGVGLSVNFGLVGVGTVGSLRVAMLEFMGLSVLALGSSVVFIVLVTDNFVISLSVMVGVSRNLFVSISAVVDQRSLVSADILNDLVNDGSVDNMSDFLVVDERDLVVDDGLVVNGSGVVVNDVVGINDGMVDDGDLVVSVGDDIVGLVVVVLGVIGKVSLGVVDNLLVNVSLSLMRGLGSTVLLGVVRILSNGSLVMNDFVVVRELTGVAIVVVHLEVKLTVLDVDLAGHEEGRVVLEAPVVAGVPFLGIPGVEVISPSELEVLGGLIIIVNFNEVVLGVPGHLGVIEIVVPWGPHRTPEVHHELSGHVEEVNILLTFALANEFVVDVPADIVGSPFDGVGEPVRAGVETGGVVVVLSSILPDDVHGEGVLSDGWDNLNIDLVPAMGPVLSGVGEEGLNGTHLSWVLHLNDELSVGEPFLGADLTRKIVSLSDSSECNNSGSKLVHLDLVL